jgi:hypothetical protein
MSPPAVKVVWFGCISYLSNVEGGKSFISPVWTLLYLATVATTTSICRGRWGVKPQSTHRVAMTTFCMAYIPSWRKNQPTGEGGGARRPSFTISTIKHKVVVYAPADRADTPFYSTPICTQWLRTAVFIYLVCDWENMQRNTQSLVSQARCAEYKWLDKNFRTRILIIRSSG